MYITITHYFIICIERSSQFLNYFEDATTVQKVT